MSILIALLLSSAAQASVVNLPSDRMAFCFNGDNSPIGCEERGLAWFVLRDEIERARAAEQNAGPPARAPEEPKPKVDKPYNGDWSVAGNMGWTHDSQGAEDTTTGGTFGAKVGFRLWAVDANLMLPSEGSLGGVNGSTFGVETRFSRLVPVYDAFGVRLVASGGKARRVQWMNSGSTFAGAGAELVYAGAEHGFTIGARYDHLFNQQSTDVTDWSGTHRASDLRRSGLGLYVEWNRILSGQHFLHWRLKHPKPAKQEEKK
ncbi:MAG TPA: hypothetical protein VM598_11495 [Bdellovibrionota bacterium]|nr:hypothetical protein [Bdellovibrionota bacterium]